MSPTIGPHFVVPPAAIDRATVRLAGDDAHHLATALRAAPGDPVSVADGVGTLYQCRVADVGDAVVLGVEEAVEVAAERPALRVVHAVAKRRKLDDVVRRLTELGVDEFVPVTTARTEPDPRGEGAERALGRWRAVAHAAAKQSRRAWLPTVRPVTAWQDALADAEAGAVCWEEATVPLREALGDAGDAEWLTLAVGPEGGLTAEEVAAAGLPPARIVSTVLRAETAGLVAAVATLTLVGRIA